MSRFTLPTAFLRGLRTVLPQRYVVIHGFYGMGNVGDEAILEATLEEVRRVTDLEPFVFAWNPERVRDDFGVPSLDPNRRHSFHATRVLLQAKVYLLGGGGLVKDYGGSPASLARWLHWPELAHALGVRTMLWSVGVENVVFNESLELVRRSLQQVDVVTVRDPSSEVRLKEIGVTRSIVVTADPVPHYVRSRLRENGHVRYPAHTLQRIGVCPRHWFTLDNSIPDEQAFNRLLAAVADALDDLGGRYSSEIVFIPFRTTPKDDDRVICQAISDRMRYRRIVHYDEKTPAVRQTLQRMAGCDLIVGMRLHAAIMATSMGIPTLAISYMPKVEDYMSSIDQSGFCRNVEDVSSEWLIARADEAVARYETLSSALDIATAHLGERFLQNGRLLAELLENN